VTGAALAADPLGDASLLLHDASSMAADAASAVRATTLSLFAWVLLSVFVDSAEHPQSGRATAPSSNDFDIVLDNGFAK
jgi:hypothetical protein